MSIKAPRKSKWGEKEDIIVNKLMVAVFFAFLLVPPQGRSQDQVVNNYLWSLFSQPTECVPLRFTQQGRALLVRCPEGFRLLGENGREVVRDQDVNLGTETMSPGAHLVTDGDKLFFASTKSIWKYSFSSQKLKKLYQIGQQIILQGLLGTIAGELVSVDGPWPGKDGRETVVLQVKSANGLLTKGVYERTATGQHQLLLLAQSLDPGGSGLGINMFQPSFNKDSRLVLIKSEPAGGTAPPRTSLLLLTEETGKFTSVVIANDTSRELVSYVMNESYQLIARWGTKMALVAGSSLEKVLDRGVAVDFAGDEVLLHEFGTGNLLTWNPLNGKTDIVAQTKVDAFQGKLLNNMYGTLSRLLAPGSVLFAMANGSNIERLILARRPVVTNFPTQIPLDGKMLLTGNNLLIEGTQPRLLVNGTLTVPTRWTNNEILFSAVGNGDQEVRVELTHSTGTLRSEPVTIKGNPLLKPAAIVTKVLTGTLEERPLAPGGLGTLIGTNLCGVVVEATAAIEPLTFAGNRRPLPTELGRCRVLVDGKALPLMFAATFTGGYSQINFQLPSAVARPELVVERLTFETGALDAVSQVFPFRLERTAPVMFKNDDLVILQAANRGYQLVNKESPLQAGDVAVGYGTGFGQTSPEVPAGMAGEDIGELANTVEPLRAFLKILQGDEWVYWELEVLYSIASPQFPGVAQFAFRVPDGLAHEGEKGYLVIKVGEVQTDEMAVPLTRR